MNVDKFPTISEYSKYFKQLVELEREEEQKRHKEEIRKFSPKKREQVGRAVLNLYFINQRRGISNTIEITYGREESFGDHEFSIGDLVIVTPFKKPTGKEQTATITEITKRSITIAYPSNPPQEILQKKRTMRIDLFTNDITFARMLGALKRVDSVPHLKRIILGRPLLKPDTSKSRKLSFFNKNLNETQKQAVEETIIQPEIFFLHGPPGTGKTTTLVESIIQHMEKGNKILVSADSNTAIDTITEKILDYTQSVIRIGNTIKTTSSVYEHTLDYKLQYEDFFNDAKNLFNEIDSIKKKQAEVTKPTRDLKRGLSDEQILNYARKRTTTRGIPIKTMKKMGTWITHQKTIKELYHKAKVFENESILNLLDDASIICTTNSNSASEILQNYLNLSKTTFDVCYVDEATQSVEPSTLIPALLAPKLILAGDHKQLPPTVLNQRAKGLSYSLFERLVNIYGYQHYIQLNVQYRMNEEIMRFPNKEFYNNTLIADESVKNKRLTIKEKGTINDCPLEKIDVKGEEKKHNESTSFFNEDEAKEVLSIVNTLLSPFYSFNSQEIGIISPYLAQVQYLKKKLEGTGVEVKSIDGFQGREKEVIIISFVRSNQNGNLGFLEDKRRLNVALTRAKKKLILIGNWNTLTNSQLYNNLYNSLNVKTC